MESSLSFFWVTLDRWYLQNKRIFPWRLSSNPYHIFIAEFLLQQTHVRKVEEVYLQLLNRFPTITELMNADEKDLLQYISPLGLSYRASRLKEASIVINDKYYSEIPDNYNALIKLPGIGDYIANAVLCYGYHQKTIPIDTNVIRLFCRYFGLTSDKPRPRTDKVLASKIRKLYPLDLDYKNANLAVLDFAGLVCTARKQKCIECPLSEQCSYYSKEPLTHNE
ncbi:hypothetical protein [Paenibacillus xerothermodurans]|uniref:HhH-GPD domain-containing protein n=1 Tax=Paenibacillus xerothermodurans TaxID=1977292 RepID=A0A2W1NRF5_PAEXE|nr:hypothetical protein [Paenibacillus xerothermodurans]PZE20326.1 hypothetical protein CBW46_014370 [Paenibacillus xerothermodurans]